MSVKQEQAMITAKMSLAGPALLVVIVATLGFLLLSGCDKEESVAEPEPEAEAEAEVQEETQTYEEAIVELAAQLEASPTAVATSRQDLTVGSQLSRDDISTGRAPDQFLPPDVVFLVDVDQFYGRTLIVDLPRGTVLREEYFESEEP